jgi:catechol 2,3-dioxygenase-like lactoylglutathione lyase family enzyme
MEPTLNQVYLMVTDLDNSIRFYHEKLGLDLRDRGTRSATLDTGACTLEIERDFDEETLAAYGLSPPAEPRGEGVILVLEVEDIDRTYERAVRSDVELRMEPRDVEWGRRLFLVEDPDGYVLEIFQPLED